ncbi:hypothetical protein [Lysobacter silvisoli]|uniref:Uncharacterized protein n=1 Tax=Lysobacter silvisoli TaxID=2293254 RepID=A0A371K0G6_9GAMM|nr:hypothetical protein [Lysobacter silvisoli]RDZ27342.1 hypothetical protein DX914_13990 [Lysobacter silvisoli]
MQPIDQAYAAPNSVVIPPEAQRRPSTAWWLQFALVALAAAVTLGLQVYKQTLLPANTPFWPYRMAGFMVPLLLALGAAGLYGYIRVQRVGPRWLWVVYLIAMWFVTLIIGGMQGFTAHSALAAEAAGIRVPGAEIGMKSALTYVFHLLCTLSVSIPLMFALSRYISRYPQLWGRRPSPQPLSRERERG